MAWAVQRCMLPHLLVLTLACMPAPRQPSPVTTRCEGRDSVTRDHDHRTLARVPEACVVTRCEGPHFVQRLNDGRVVERIAFAPRCQPLPRPIVTPRSEAWRFGLSAR